MGPEAAGAPGLSTADDVAQTKRKATHRDSAAVKALRSYMQDVSELQVPTWQVRLDLGLALSLQSTALHLALR